MAKEFHAPEGEGIYTPREAMFKTSVNMKQEEATTWIKQEGDLETDKNTESNAVDLTTQVTQDQEDDDEKHKVVMETNIEGEEANASTDLAKNPNTTMFLSFPVEDYLYCEECKLEYEGVCPEHGPFIYVNDAETNLKQSGSKDLSNEIKKPSNLKKRLPGPKKLEQPALFGEGQEMHSCAQCYLLFPTLEDLQKHERSMHDDKNLEPKKDDKPPDALPEGKQKKGNKIINIANKLLNMKGGGSVSEVRQENTESRKAENEASADPVGCEESAGDAYEDQSDRNLKLQRGDYSKLSKVFPIYKKNAEPCGISMSFKLQSNVQSQIDGNIHRVENSACAVCGEGICQCLCLTTAQRLRADERPYKCPICNTGFTQEGHMQSHQRVHTGERPFKCDVCGGTFAQRNNLRRHKRVHTAEYPYKCDVCGVAFAESSNLKRHKRIHTGEKLYKCDVCGMAFTECSNLKRHKRTHTKEKPFKCDVCGVGFAVGCSLKTHMRVHTGEKPYKCEICGAGFAQSNNLKKHRWTHAPVKPFKCEACGTGFSDRGSLKTHLRKHTGEKPYKCEVCDVSFTDAASMHRHKVVHTGVKPFKCDACDVSFTDNSNLKRHMRIHTKEDS